MKKLISLGGHSIFVKDTTTAINVVAELQRQEAETLKRQQMAAEALRRQRQLDEENEKAMEAIRQRIEELNAEELKAKEVTIATEENIQKEPMLLEDDDIE